MDIVLYNDVAFKWVFGRQENTKPILSLLNAVVGYENKESAFIDIKILNPFDISAFPKQKQGILDIRVMDNQTKIWADVEVQVRYQEVYRQRSMYYLAGIYRDQLISGDDYEKLKPCYGIHILVADLFRDKDDIEWYHHFQMLNVKNYRQLNNHWQLFYIELEKFNRVLKEGQITYSELTQWCEFLYEPINISKPLSPKFQNNIGIQEVYHMLPYFTEDQRIREQYRLHEEWLREQRYYDNLMKRQEAELKKQQAELEELRKKQEELIKIKVLKEIEEQKRREEEQKRKEIERQNQEITMRSVKALRKSGMSDSEIAEILGISEMEIKKIS